LAGQWTAACKAISTAAMSRNHPIVHGPVSTINLKVGVTNEFELIVSENSTGFYAELSHKHSSNGKVQALFNIEKPD
jgi:hypothetical protein